MESRDHGAGRRRQPPETTAEPVPLRRPYIGTEDARPQGWHPAPAPRPTFSPHPQRAGQGGGTGRAHSDPTAPATPVPAAPHPPKRPPEGMRYPAVRRWRPLRAIIGDEIRIPILWCEFGTCIERYTNQDALGERDLRTRALAAGWRYDALGRLACPSCVQHDPGFWVANPPVPSPRQSP
jgi:hypothetical protein